jgi:hypothetical protein
LDEEKNIKEIQIAIVRKQVDRGNLVLYLQTSPYVTPVSQNSLNLA